MSTHKKCQRCFWREGQYCYNKELVEDSRPDQYIPAREFVSEELIYRCGKNIETKAKIEKLRKQIKLLRREIARLKRQRFTKDLKQEKESAQIWTDGWGN